jgi:hypothetical protein
MHVFSPPKSGKIWLPTSMTCRSASQRSAAVSMRGARRIALNGRHVGVMRPGLAALLDWLGVLVHGCQAYGLRPQARKDRWGMTRVWGSSRWMRTARSSAWSSSWSARPRLTIRG